jgi:hypothetical protein
MLVKSYKQIIVLAFVSAFLATFASQSAAYAANYCTPAQNCLLSGGVAPPTTAPAPGEAYTGMFSGVFEYSKTDLTIAAPIPIEITRTYREFDVNGAGNGPIYGAFGIGTTLNYDIYLYSSTEVANGNYSNASLVLPDGGQILCTNTNTTSCSQSSCPFTTSTQFQCNTQPIGKWFNSLITWDAGAPGGGGWTLNRKDGTVYTFGAGAPLQEIEDRNHNTIMLTRQGVGSNIQLGNVATIAASNGRQVTLNYNATNCCIISYSDPRKITYSYTSGQLETVSYPNISSTPIVSYKWDSAQPQNLQQIAVAINATTKDYINIAYTNSAKQVTSIYPGHPGKPSLGV